MSLDLPPTFHESVYAVSEPFPDGGIPKEIGNYLGINDLEIEPFPKYLGGDIVIDGEVSFGISKGSSYPNAVCSLVREQDAWTVVQMQATDGSVRDVFGKEWPFLLLAIAEEIARRTGESVLRIQAGEDNIYCPAEDEDSAEWPFETHGLTLDEIRRDMLLRYNGTAKKAGYRRNSSGVYQKDIT